jgi:hypothetical protein
MKTRNILAALAVLVAAGCSTMSSPTAERYELTVATAVVESVNQSTREVRLRSPEGELLIITAGPEVKNLPQLEAGDQVEFSFYESTVVAMADSSDPGYPEAVALAESAPAGGKPGALAVISASFVVEILSYDEASGLITVLMPDGETRRTTVKPELRTFAEGLSTGNRVLVTMTDAVAITINETAS